MLNEPVRGALPPPSFFSLSGLEQLRAGMRGLVPNAPVTKLFQIRPTQASAGTCVVSQTLSPWFDTGTGSVNLAPLSELALFGASLSGAPPATEVRTINLSMRYLRPCTLESETVLARGRILYAGSSFTTVEVFVEDTLGRAVAHASGSVIHRPIEPAPPALLEPLQPTEEPSYQTPDPARRPPPPALSLQEIVATALSTDDRAGLRAPLFLEFLGIRLLELSEGYVKTGLPLTEYFSGPYRHVRPGVISQLVDSAAAMAVATTIRPGQRLAINNITCSFLRPVLPEEAELVVVGRLRHRGDVLVADADVSDAEGKLVAVGHGTFLLVDGGERRARTPGERVLLTVLFTDLVGSTERAEQLGDSAWRQVLENHHAVVRRQLELFGGREVKTTGDGFLATFDSPTRAVGCARAVRDALDRLELAVRIGIHTGECEVMGADVGGVAVHVASRIQAAAGPGKILVSAAVRDLASAGVSGFADRGVHELKGLDGTHRLFAVTE